MVGRVQFRAMGEIQELFIRDPIKEPEGSANNDGLERTTGLRVVAALTCNVQSES